MFVIITLNQNPKNYESIPSSKIALFLEGDGKFTPFRYHLMLQMEMIFSKSFVFLNTASLAVLFFCFFFNWRFFFQKMKNSRKFFCHFLGEFFAIFRNKNNYISHN